MNEAELANLAALLRMAAADPRYQDIQGLLTKTASVIDPNPPDSSPKAWSGRWAYRDPRDGP